MRIAINTRFLLKSKMEGFGWFTYETVKRIVINHPEHDFFFFFDRPFDPKFIFAKNVTPVVLYPPARHPILFKIWFNHSVTKALKKYAIDLFFSPDGFLSLKTTIPQIGVIHDLNFEHFPADIPKAPRKYLQKYFPLFAQKATALLTVSEFSKQDLIQTYSIASDKITVAYNGASDLFKPISAQAQQQIREKYTNGSAYFLYVGALHARKNIIRLFQAYDQFKTEHKSETKLLIVGTPLWKNEHFNTTYQQLRHKKDIIFAGHLALDELTKVTASAKALTFVSYFEGFGIPLIEAMKCETPIISGNKTALPEVAGDAALLVNPYDINAISVALKEMDTDEALRKKLIKKGVERSKKFNWDLTAETIWKVIANALN